MAVCLVSVLLPSRRRPESLKRSCDSLLSKANDESRLEFLVAYDNDDLETRDVAESLGHTSVGFERHGYHNLHLYVNELASIANGDWLFLWNDDAIMETPDWDCVVSGFDPRRPFVLSPSSTGVGHSMCCFPIVSAGLFSRLGHMSLSNHIDSWLQDLGNATGILRNVPIDILHDRCDFTGGHDDETWAESRAGYRTSEFYSAKMQALLHKDMKKVRSC